MAAMRFHTIVTAHPKEKSFLKSSGHEVTLAIALVNSYTFTTYHLTYDEAVELEEKLSKALRSIPR